MDTATSVDRQAAALRELAQFPLLDALYGRRAHRIALGSTIPDGPLAYESPHQPVPLTELERMIVLTSMAGTTGWHYSTTATRPTPATWRTTRRVRPGAR